MRSVRLGTRVEHRRARWCAGSGASPPPCTQTHVRDRTNGGVGEQVDAVARM